MGFLAAQLFLNGISAPSSLDLQIVSAVGNRLSENIFEIQEILDVSRKMVSRHEDGKNMSAQKNYILIPFRIMLQIAF